MDNKYIEYLENKIENIKKTLDYLNAEYKRESEQIQSYSDNINNQNLEDINRQITENQSELEKCQEALRMYKQFENSYSSTTSEITYQVETPIEEHNDVESTIEENAEVEEKEQDELEKIKEEIMKSISNFQKIFIEEEQEKTSDVHTKEELETIDKKYMDMKEKENQNLENLNRLKKELEEKLEKEIFRVKQLPAVIYNEKKLPKPIIITNNQNKNITKNSEKVSNKKNNTTKTQTRKTQPKEQKSTRQIISSLMDGLTFNYKKDNKKYVRNKLEVIKAFKDELNSGNHLYNVVRIGNATVGLVSNTINKITSNITTTNEDKEKYRVLKERIDDLYRNDKKAFLQLINEFKGNNALEMRIPLILNTMLKEKYKEYVIEEVEKINEQINKIHTKIYDDYEKIKLIDITVRQIGLSKEKQEELLVKRAELIDGKSKVIEKIRKLEFKVDNLISSNNLEDINSDLKISDVTKRFKKDYKRNPHFIKIEAELDQNIVDAIAAKDDQKAYENFIALEQLEIENANTEYSSSIKNNN